MTVPGTSDSGTVWVSTTLDAPVTLRDGTRYDLLLVTSEGTQYTADPIREGTDAGLRSYRFTDGSGQHTLDGGESWADLYRGARSTCSSTSGDRGSDGRTIDVGRACPARTCHRHDQRR